jgi:hypothetical protein
MGGNITIHLKGIGWNGVDWNDVAEDRHLQSC